MITINTINNSWYFIEDFVIKPNSSEEFDESLLSFEQTRDLLNAQRNQRISLSVQDKGILEQRLELLDGHLSQNELKTINGISLVGTGDVSVGSSQATTDLESACHISGGDITILSGNNFSISSGVGYARNPSGDLVRITWNAVPTIATQYGGANYVGFDYNSQPVFSNQPLSSEYCPVGYVFTTGSNTVAIGFASVRLSGKDALYRLGDLFRNTIGSLVELGASTSIKPAPDGLGLVVSQGTIWHLINKFQITQTDQFTKLYNSTSGFVIDSTNPNLIDNTHYNDVSLAGTSARTPLTAGYYKKDLIALTPSDKVYYLYGTSEWTTEEEARTAPLPSVPETIKNSVVRSAALIVQKDAPTPSVVLDIRPMFTKLFETGSAASNATVISHSDLTDLSNDDHTQYHTDARGDVRYYRKSEVDTLIETKADTTHTHTAATTSNSGFMSASDKVKLDSIQAGANQNSTDVFLLNRANHTGTQPSNTISDLAATVTTLINNRITDQVIDGDTVTAPTQNAVFDLVATKANLTHTHPISDVTGLSTSLANKADVSHTHTSTQITDFTSATRTAVVDDAIVDGVTNKAPSQNAVFDSLANKANLNHTHVVSQITDYTTATDARIATYVSNTSIDALNDVDTTGKVNGQVLTYNTTTSQWVPTTPVVYGDMSKTTYDTTNNGVVDNSERLNNQLPAFYLSRTNHTGTQDVSTITGLTKASVGLGNVDNTSDLNKPLSTATQTALNTKEPTIATGLSTDYIAGDKTIKQLNTGNVAESLDKRFVTDAQRTVIQNTSGTNTGDETTATIKSKLGVASTTQEGYLTAANFNTFNNKEPALPLGTNTQYFRGDKTLATLDKNTVGLGNVQNVDTTNASNITSGSLDLARLNNTALQTLANTTFSEGTVMVYVDSNFKTVTIESTTNNVLFNLTSTGLDVNAKYGNHPNNPYFSFMEHFVGTAVASTLSPYFARVVNVGTTAIVVPTIGDNRMGVISLNTGTSTTGSVTLTTNSILTINFSNLAVGGYYETGCSFRIPVLSDAAQTYGLVLGFGDGSTTLPVDGAYVYYTTAGVTGRTVSNSTITSTAITGLTNLTVNTGYVTKVRVTKTSASTYSAEFFVNGFSATLTTGLPITAGRETSVQYSIVKSAGLTSRLVELDWIYFERYNPVNINY